MLSPLELFSPSFCISPKILDRYPNIRHLNIREVFWGGEFFGGIEVLAGSEISEGDVTTKIRIYDSDLEFTKFKGGLNQAPVSIIACYNSAKIKLVTVGGHVVIRSSPTHLPIALKMISEASFRMGTWFTSKYKRFSKEEIRDDAEPPVDHTFSERLNYPRAALPLNSLRNQSAEISVVCFSDGLRKPSSVFFKDGVRRPIFCFARHTEYAADYILVPLPTHQKFGAESFQALDPAPVEDISKIFWRGSPTGVTHNSFGKALHFKTLIDINANVDSVLLRLMYSAYLRFQFVYFAQRKSWIDAGFISAIPKFSMLSKPPVTRQQAIKYKFQMALEGNDFASSLPWQLLNGVVVFTPQPRFQSIFNYGLCHLHNCLICDRDFMNLESLYMLAFNDSGLSERLSMAGVHYASSFADEDYQELLFQLIVKIYSNAAC